MDRPRAPVLLLALLTLCITAGELGAERSGRHGGQVETQPWGAPMSLSHRDS